MTKWTPDKVQEVCGVPEAQVYKVAEMMAKNRPSTVVWCMGQTQHTTGNAIVRASCILQLALGNVGVAGGGTNIFRGHDNVQGATDVGPNPDSLPGYYGVAAGAWKHYASGVGRRLRVDQEAVRRRHDGKAGHDGLALDRRRAAAERRDRPGPEPSRHGVLGPRAEQPDARRRDAGGDAGARPARRDRPVSVRDRGDGGDAARPSRARRCLADAGKKANPNRAVYLLPACTQFETSGSVTASNRSLQWRERVISADVRVADRPRDHGRVREEVRLGQGVRQELRDVEARRRRQVRGARRRNRS